MATLFSKLSIHIRSAEPDDARLIAELANQAAEGMPLYVWREMAGLKGDPWVFGRNRVLSDDSPISWRHTHIAEVSGTPAGCLICHEMPANPPLPGPDTPSFFRPLWELESRAGLTGYIYVLSTLPAHQGRGIGTRLLLYAERFKGEKGMSLVVSDANTSARKLYERHGYRITDRLPMVKQGFDNPGTEWLLMIKPAGWG